MITEAAIREIAVQDVRPVPWVCFMMACHPTDSFAAYVDARWEDVRALHSIEPAYLEAAKRYLGDEFDRACCAHVAALFA